MCRHSHTDERDHAGDKEEGKDADEAGGEPVVLFALVEHDLQAAHGDGEEAEAEVVHVAQAGAVGLDPGRVFDQAGDEDEGEDADRDVDEEDPAPGEVVGDPAAKGGADGGREDGDEAVEGEGLAALLGLEGVGHDGLGHGLHAAAARALQNAADEQHGQRGRRAAEKAGDGKDDNAEQKEVAPSHDAGGPGADGQHDGVGDQIAGQHPGALVGACAQVAGNVRQGHVGDGGVENLHKGRQGYGGGDQPGIDAGFPLRGRRGCDGGIVHLAESDCAAGWGCWC